MEKNNKAVTSIETTGFVGNQGSFKANIAVVEETFEDSDGLIQLDIENLDKAVICEEKTVVNGVQGIEGELLISRNKDIDANVDLNGDFILSGEGMENYYIDEMGNLIFEY